MICKYLVVLSWDEKVATLDNGITLLIEVVEKSSFIRIKLQVGVNTLCSVTGKLTFHKLMIPIICIHIATVQSCLPCEKSFEIIRTVLQTMREHWLSIISTKRWGKVSKYVLSWQWMDNIFIQSIMGTGFHINGHTSTALKIINRVLPAFQDPDRRFRMEMIRRHKPWNKRREQIQLNEAQVYFKCSTFHSKNTITDWDTILS